MVTFQTYYGYDLEDMGGWDELALTQVHDVWTGDLVAAFKRLRRFDTPSDHKAWDATYKAARAKAEWKGFARSQKLVEAKPSLTSPDGRWTLSVKAVSKVKQGTFKVTEDKKEQRFTMAWEGFPGENSGEEEDGPVERGPWLQVHMSGPGMKAWPIAKLRFPKSSKQITECDGFAASGWLTGAWAPDSSRVLLIASADVEGAHEEWGVMPSARFHIRAVGPQIAITDAGAGVEATRAVARRAEAAGLRVSRIVTTKQTTRGVDIEWRGAGEPLAKQIAAMLDGSAEVTKAELAWGLSHVVVRMGR